MVSRMAGSLGAETDRGGASFELERLELEDDRLVVRGWWHGVRGMRFVRPALIVDGRKRLATLEHKPWAAAPDGAWTAAFPWKHRGPPDAAGVTLVVAPSVEVPLDRHATESLAAVATPSPFAAGEATSEPDGDPAELSRSAGGQAASEPRPGDEAQPARTDQPELLLAELREAAAAREQRCRELEGALNRERRAAHDALVDRDEATRIYATAASDRDRAIAQHAEAVNDREAAVRSRGRMEAERDEAFAQRDEALSKRDELARKLDETHRQREEILLAHQALQRQLRGRWSQQDRERQADRQPPDGEPAQRPILSDEEADRPSGVRMIPAARTIAAHLHRSQRERDHGLTQFDMWGVRILGTVAAVAFIALMVMLMKAFFVF